MRASLSFTIAVLLSLTACSNPDSATSGAADIMPLAVGNRWIGEVYCHGDSTNSDERLWLDTLIVTGTMSISGEKWYIVQHRGIADAFTDSAQLDLWMDRADGLYSRSMRTDTNVIGAPSRVVAYPGAISDTTQTQPIGTNYSDQRIGIMYQKLVSKSDAVQVPAGSFVAHKWETYFAYDSTGRTPEASGNIDWYVPGIGEVKTVQHVGFSHIYSNAGLLSIPTTFADKNWLGYRLLSYRLQ
jgi:hypothetical protein